MVWILNSFCNISCFYKRYCLFNYNRLQSLQWACNIISLPSASAVVFARLHACSCEQILPSVTRLLCLESLLERPLLQTQHYIRVCYIWHTIHSLRHSQRGMTLNVSTEYANIVSVWKFKPKNSFWKPAQIESYTEVCRDWKCPGDCGLPLPLLRDKVY